MNQLQKDDIISLGDNMIEYDKYYQFERLNEYKNISHLFTKKDIDFNRKVKTVEELDQQFNEIKDILGVDFDIVFPIQKHTNIVKKVDESNIHDDFESVDGTITNLKNVALVVSAADCQSILLYDKNKNVIGNIHSGWKGTLGRIIKNAIDLMVKEYNSDVNDIEAYICPSILKCCFEVDLDVADLFIKEFKDIDINSLITKKGDKYYIDTVGINKEVLLNLGLKEENIIESNICSKCNSDKVHSHRGSNGSGGRNISIIVLK